MSFGYRLLGFGSGGVPDVIAGSGGKSLRSIGERIMSIVIFITIINRKD
jgi:hypothetical protein